MNDLYAGIDELEDELDFLGVRFGIEYRINKNKVYNVSIGTSEKMVKEVCKVTCMNYKDLVSFMDWINEPKQLEKVTYIYNN